MAAPAQFEVEADPIAYGLKGFSGHIGHGVFNDYSRIQVGGFGAETPEFFHGNEGFTQSSRGVTVKLDHFFKRGHKGWFVGADGDYSRVRYKWNATGASTGRNLAALGPRAGYRFGIGDHLYIVPWVSTNYVFNAHNVALSGNTFKEKSFRVFPTVHVGWKF